MNSENHEINSEALKYYRNEKSYSQADLANLLRVATNTVSRWETGETKVTQKNQRKLVNVLGFPLKWLREPLPEHKKRTSEKRGPRAGSTISESAKVALDIVSETYHINRDAIMDIAPFLFHAVAAASLGRRAAKLDEMDKELEKVMEICQEKLPYIPGGVFIESSKDGGSLALEQDAINDNQLFFSYDISHDVNDISTNPFSQFLKSFTDLMPERLSELFEVEWRNDELPRYHVTDSFIREILLIPVDDDLLEQIMELVLSGSMSLKEINYRVSAAWMNDESKERFRGDIINEIKKKVAEKQASHHASKQPVTGEDR